MKNFFSSLLRSILSVIRFVLGIALLLVSVVIYSIMKIVILFYNVLANIAIRVFSPLSSIYDSLN